MRPLILVSLLSSGCAATDPQVAAVLELEGDPVVGEELFQGECSLCHGEDARGSNVHMDAAAAVWRDEASAVSTILYGNDEAYLSMWAYEDEFTSQQIADIVSWLWEAE